MTIETKSGDIFETSEINFSRCSEEVSFIDESDNNTGDRIKLWWIEIDKITQ